MLDALFTMHQYDGRGWTGNSPPTTTTTNYCNEMTSAYSNTTVKKQIILFSLGKAMSQFYKQV